MECEGQSGVLVDVGIFFQVFDCSQVVVIVDMVINGVMVVLICVVVVGLVGNFDGGMKFMVVFLVLGVSDVVVIILVGMIGGVNQEMLEQLWVVVLWIYCFVF